MNLLTKQKQTHRQRKQTYGYQRDSGEVGGEINQELGINIYILLYIKKNTLGPTVQYRELYSVSRNNLQWKRI